MSVKNCLSCGTEMGGDTGKKDAGRGLCGSCHSRHNHKGTLEQFPRKMWKAAELIAEADHLREHGATREQVAQQLGVKWSSIVSAKQRQRAKREADANHMVYTEHAKLAKIASQSQAIGEFVEWLGTEGVHLMRWTETTDIRACEGTLLADRCRGDKCKVCKGANVVEVKLSAWVPYGVTIPTMLASFFEIDQNKIEAEKRHMLEDLRKRNEAKK